MRKIIISQNNKSSNVTTHVDTHIAVLCATHKPLDICIAIVVANDAVKTFTKLFHIKIVISNLSLLAFNFFNSLDPNFFCFTKASILCSGIDINAVSLLEKNADNKNKTTNTNTVDGPI